MIVTANSLNEYALFFMEHTEWARERADGFPGFLDDVVTRGAMTFGMRNSLSGQLLELGLFCPTRGRETDVYAFTRGEWEPDPMGMFLFVVLFCRHPRLVGPIHRKLYRECCLRNWPNLEYWYYTRSARGDRIAMGKIHE